MFNTCILYQCIYNVPFLDIKPSHVLAHLTPISDDTSPVGGQGSGQFEGDTFIGTVNIGVLPGKKKWLISFSLVYNSGLYINVSQPTVFSKLIYYIVLSYVYETCLLATFDVQNGNLEVIDSTIGEVCFTCYFVIGSQSHGCYTESITNVISSSPSPTTLFTACDYNKLLIIIITIEFILLLLQ